MFNPEEFNNTTFEGEFETKRTLVPAGEYTVRIEECTAKQIGEANYPILSMRYALTNTGDEALDERQIFDTIWLDVTEQGSLERGPDKNIKLGQLLAALGLNGKPWSPAGLVGSPLIVTVTHSQNKKSGEMEARVSRYAEAA